MANGITVCRILFSAALLFCSPFSPAFVVLYLAAGLSDMADGIVARKTHTESETGEKLDSIADVFFILVCLIKLLPVLKMKPWLWIWVGLIAAAKIINYICWFACKKQPVELHTKANKVTGLLLFLLPLTLKLIDFSIGASVVCAAATVTVVLEVCSLRNQ